MELTNHQSLLEAYYSAARSDIWEFDFAIDEEVKRLNDEVTEYAKLHNLDSSFVLEKMVNDGKD